MLRGGGIIFTLGIWVWALKGLMVDGLGVMDSTCSPELDCYPFFLIGLTLLAGLSFVDDIHSLPDSVRLVVQFAAAALAFYQLGMLSGEWFETNGVLVPLFLLNTNCHELSTNYTNGFVDNSLVVCAILSALVFCIFNFRPKGKAKCFAGDVGSIGIAFILLFLIGKVIIATGDLTYLVFLLVYGVDGVLTICHRIMLHENLGEAHRKHAYQLMCNELKIGHVKVSLLYMCLQLVVSLGFIFACPWLASFSGLSLVLVHWIYLIVALVVLAVAYVAFKKKYYWMHEEYLKGLER